MTSESRRIAEEIHYSVSGPAWHGPALAEMLAGVDASTADSRPVANAHTIHEIVLHLITWQELGTRAIHGEAVPEWPFPEDWPSHEGRTWEGTLDHLLHSTQALVRAVNALPAEKLEAIVPGRDHSFHYMLRGVTQHNAYHGGQIALLKKLAQPRTS